MIYTLSNKKLQVLSPLARIIVLLAMVCWAVGYIEGWLTLWACKFPKIEPYLHVYTDAIDKIMKWTVYILNDQISQNQSGCEIVDKVFITLDIIHNLKCKVLTCLVLKPEYSSITRSVPWLLGNNLGVVSLTFCELSKIISRKNTTPEITGIMRISSLSFAHISKAWFLAHI